jgi:exonuclease SbcC
VIKILRLEATNFRSLGHAVVEPLTDGGLTAINGPNGAGKSSLLAAVIFALYGATPDGVSIKALRRQGSTDDVRVILTFTHDGQTITVERGLKGVKDAHYAKVVVDGIEQVFGKVTASTAWMEQRLGLDVEGFLTAFAIRQKELDGLVKAKPAARRALIERLAGIDKMSTAVQTARAEESEARKRLELLPGSSEDLKAAKDALEVAQSRAVEAWETFEQARDAAAVAEQDWSQVSAETDAMQARIAAHDTARQAATSARHDASLAVERANVADAHAARLADAAQGGTSDDVASAHARHDAALTAAQANRDAREHAERATTELGREEQRTAQSADRAARLKSAASAARKVATDTAAKAASFPTDLDAQEQAAAQAADALSQRVGALRGEHARLDASIKALEATTDPACPTCSTSLADPGALLATLRQAQARVQTDGQSAARDEKAARENLAQVRERAEAARATAREAQYASEQAQAADEQAQAAQTEAEQARAVWENLKSVSDVAQGAARDAIAAQEAVTAEVAAAGQALRRAETAAAAAADLDAATTAAATARADADTALALADTAEKSAADLLVPDAEKDQARQRYTQAQVAARESAATAQRADADFRVAQEQVTSAERHRDAEDAKVKARTAALADFEMKSAVKSALDAFRKERIAALAPELSEAATDLIPAMTDGKFVAIELDEEFTPVITDDQGMQRPVAWLSGGEESAVALAMRLALGEIIAGTAGGLLWMDEPQTAMDAARRPAMMSVVRSIPGRQPIQVSHVSEASDMADLVLDVVPDADNGSTVAVAGYAAPLDTDDLPEGNVA